MTPLHDHGRETADVAGGRELLRLAHYTFKQAETADELDQVHRLNHKTFVREIPQHVDAGTDYLVDKFHHKNLYFVAIRGRQVVGMVAAHDQPPFSVVERLSDPAALEQLGGARLLEVRLLAVEPGERHGLVFAGLMWSLYLFARRVGYSHVVISGLSDRQSLYEHLGFRALGPAVGSDSASFVPMVLALDDLPQAIRQDIQRWQRRLRVNCPRSSAATVCFLPGPVQVAPEVRAAFALPPGSHRSREFVAQFERVRRALSELVGGLDVALLVGSGTLANDVVAGTLASDCQRRPGLLLANGEFGGRLAGQAERMGLEFQLLAQPWGESWNLDEVAGALATNPQIGWIWGVHLESSTGVLNDLRGLVRLAAARDLRVCVDCVSSLGAVPIDLRGIHLASGVSGKALGAYAGLAMVFASPGALTGVNARRLPTYLDLPAAMAAVGPRFTCPTPELRALDRTLESYASPAARQSRYDHYAELGRYVRDELRSLGVEPLAAEWRTSPTITTFTPPGQLSSADFVEECQGWGFEVGGLSEYLSERRWVQIATMGAVTRDDCRRFFDHLRDWMRGLGACGATRHRARVRRSLRQQASSA